MCGSQDLKSIGNVLMCIKFYIVQRLGVNDLRDGQLATRVDFVTTENKIPCLLKRTYCLPFLHQTKRGTSQKKKYLVTDHASLLLCVTDLCTALWFIEKPMPSIPSRAFFQLELGGVRLEEETGSVADQRHLLEIMELNERLAKTQNKEEANGIGLSVRG